MWRLSVMCVLIWPVMAQAQGFCALNCRASVPWGNELAYEACVALVCQGPGVADPAWEAGRMEDPEHGGFASVSGLGGAEQLILTCESQGPMSLILRSGRMDRGEVQLQVDGTGVEWLELRQAGGALVSELPRASRLPHALRDGGAVELISADGRVVSRFGLRGSDRAIAEALGYCEER